MKKHSGKAVPIFLAAMLIVILGLLLYRISEGEKTVDETYTLAGFNWNSYRTIAHALGAVDDKVYLNSKEGFLEAYENGCRLFEVDLAETSDGTWVCRHTWKQSLGQWKGGKKVLTEKEFCELPLYGTYTPLRFRDLISLLKDYPDAYILTDAKKYSIRDYDNTVADYSAYLDIAKEAAGEDVLHQIIPIVYNEEMFEGASSLYPFTSYMYSLWQEYTMEEMESIADFCQKKGISAVAVNYQHWTAKVQDMFEKRGINVFLYTLNDLSIAKKFAGKGVAGFCTDKMKENDFTDFK